MSERTRRVFIQRAALGFCVANVSMLAPSSSQASTEHHVEIRAFEFVPEHLSVTVGDTIVWTNFDIVPHTATADDLSWDTGTLAQNTSWRMTIVEGMTLDYFCAFHPHMKARLQIEIQ
jgi:plastocyanin